MGKTWFWDWAAVFGSDLSPSAKLVRLYLASRADKEQPSVSGIAGGCGISIAAARRALSELEREGWVRRDGSSEGYILCDPPGWSRKTAVAGDPPDACRPNTEKYPYKFCGHDEERRRGRKEFLKTLY